MPISRAELQREQSPAPDPLEQDSERQEQAEEEIAEEEAREHGNG